jgi:hypothetical protein
MSCLSVTPSILRNIGGIPKANERILLAMRTKSFSSSPSSSTIVCYPFLLAMTCFRKLGLISVLLKECSIREYALTCREPCLFTKAQNPKEANEILNAPAPEATIQCLCGLDGLTRSWRDLYLQPMLLIAQMPRFRQTVYSSMSI